MLAETCDRGHDIAVFGGELVDEDLLEDVITLISVLSSIIFEVTRDRGVDIAVLIEEELILIGLLVVSEVVGMVIMVCIVVLYKSHRRLNSCTLHS